MARYSITKITSRDAEAGLAFGPPVRSAGPRLLVVRPGKRPPQVGWPLIGSVAVHVCLALALALIARHAAPPNQPTPDAITVVFSPAATAAPALDASPEPAPPVPQPASEPEVPPQLDLAPSPPPETPAPPPTPQETPEPVKPPPPAEVRPPPVTPEPPPARPKPNTHPPPPRPAQRSRPMTPSPVPAPTAPSASPGAPADRPQRAVSPGWQSALGAWLQANKRYPDEAQRRGDEGRATVRFTVRRDGQVLDFKLLSGTSSTILDAAVERLLKGARLPPFPAGMDQDQVTVTLQIRYALER